MTKLLRKGCRASVLLLAGLVAGPVVAQSDPPPAGATDEMAVVPARDAPRVYGPTLAPTVPAAREMPLPDWRDAPAAIPPALVAAITTSTRANPAVLAAWDTVRASHADVTSLRWQRFPTVTTGWNRFSAGPYNSYPSVLIDLPVITFGRIGSQINRAKALQMVAIAQWRQKIIDIALQTEQAYFQVISATRRQRILEQGVKDHFRLVDSIARRVETGVSPQADLLLARSRLEQVQSDLESASAQRATAISNLGELLQGHGLTLGTIPDYDEKTFAIDWTDAADQAVQYNPSREAGLAEADAARDETSAAKASVFPQLDAQYSYDPIYGSRVGFALKLQAAGGIAQLSQVTAAQDRFRAALKQVSEVERQVRQTVEAQVVAQRSATVQASISANVAATARSVSDSYERQFIAGHRSWLDVMNAVREDINARLLRATVEVTAMDTAAQLAIGTGRWQPTLTHDEQVQEAGK